MKQMEQLLARECFFCKSTDLPYSPFKAQTARKPNLRQAVFEFYYLDVTAIVNEVFMAYTYLGKRSWQIKIKKTCT